MPTVTVRFVPVEDRHYQWDKQDDRSSDGGPDKVLALHRTDGLHQGTPRTGGVLLMTLQ
jgi:hypothetical protein